MVSRRKMRRWLKSGGFDVQNDDWQRAENEGWVEPRKDHPTKDTKNWCRGVVGRPHEPEIARTPNLWGVSPKKPCGSSGFIPCFHSRVCKNCHKILVHFLPKEECPDLNP